MKTRLTAALLALLLAPLPAHPGPCPRCTLLAELDPAPPPGPPPDLVADLSRQVAAALDLPAPPSPPAIRIVPRSHLPLIAAALSGQPVQGRDFLALYLPVSGAILLSEGWDPANPRDLSVLLHELVHHADAATGGLDPCAGTREARAYGIQSDWLEARGDSLQAAFGIDAFTLLLLTSCGH